MSQAAAQRFGDWWSGRFSRLAFNYESIEATEEDVSEKVDGWEIEFFGETMIMVTTPGQVTHGDRLMFRLNPKADCDQAEMITSFYSVGRNPNFPRLEGKVIGFKFAVDEPNVIDKEDSTTSAGGTVVAASPFLAGHRATLTFGYLPIDYWKLWMDGKTRLSRCSKAMGSSPRPTSTSPTTSGVSMASLRRSTRHLRYVAEARP